MAMHGLDFSLIACYFLVAMDYLCKVQETHSFSHTAFISLLNEYTAL